MPIATACFYINYCQTRKSGIVRVAETMIAPVDRAVRDVVNAIFLEKERLQLQYQDEKNALKKRGTRDDFQAIDTPQLGDGSEVPLPSEPVASSVLPSTQAAHATGAALAEVLQEPGEGAASRLSKTISVCLHSSTFERLQQRCSGGCSQIAQTQYLAPGVT